MLRIEKGGEGQIPDELAAYEPLVPQGKELGTYPSSLCLNVLIILLQSSH